MPPRIKPPTKEDLERDGHHELNWRYFREFARSFWRVVDPTAPLVWSRHMDVICDEIQATMEESDRRRRLERTILDACGEDDDRAARELDAAFADCPPLRKVFLIPPRNSKSTITERLLPLWRWARRPEEQHLVLSAVEDIINDNGRALRDALLSPEYHAWQHFLIAKGRLKPGDPKTCPDGHAFTLRPDQRATANFANTSGGGRHGYVISGVYVGVNADVIDIDDAHKIDDGLSDVTSPAMKLRAMNAVRGIYRDTIQDRLISKRWGVVFCIMQRVHEKDISNLMISEGAEVVCLPVEYDPTHPHVYHKDWRRVPGELLNPKRFGRAEMTLERQRSPRGYATKYMMRPSVQEGIKFKREWFRQRWNVLPDLDEIAITVDAAATANESSDFCSLQVWGRSGASRYLLDRVYRQMELPDLLESFDALCRKWPAAQFKYVENKSNGTSLISMRRDTIIGIVPVNPKGDKEARAGWAVASYQAMQVWLPDAPWVDEYVENMVGFLAGATHDDDVDATSQLMERWAMGATVWLTTDQRRSLGSVQPGDLVGDTTIRWSRKETGMTYRAGIVPGWGSPNSPGIAVVCDTAGRQVALVEVIDGGPAMVVSEIAAELRLWAPRTIRYAEVEPVLRVVTGLAKEGMRVSARVPRPGEAQKMPGQKDAGFREQDTGELWSFFLRSLGEGRAMIRDPVTLARLETVTEQEGRPVMADGTAVSGRVLAWLLALGEAPKPKEDLKTSVFARMGREQGNAEKWRVG